MASKTKKPEPLYEEPPAQPEARDVVVITPDELEQPKRKEKSPLTARMRKMQAEMMKVNKFRKDQEIAYRNMTMEKAMRSVILEENERLEVKRLKTSFEVEVMLAGGGRYAVPLQCLLHENARQMMVGPLPHFVRATEMSSEALRLLVGLHQMCTNIYHPRIETTSAELGSMFDRHQATIRKALKELHDGGYIDLLKSTQAKNVRLATGEHRKIHGQKMHIYLAVYEKFGRD